MTADIIEHVFEPFFTTKPEGRGTGLGLSMVYGFVKQSNGHINIYSEPGEGTTVRLYLPRINQSEDIATEVDVGPVSGGTETVLVVEDDEEVRSIVVDLLSDLGYRVLKAKDAQSALAIVESGTAIDLLFTDVVMPGPLRSPELARLARLRLPGIAVLFTSGYTDNAIVHGGRVDAGVELLSKPYTREMLARKLRHVLRNQQQVNALATGAAAHVTDTAKDEARALNILLVEDDTAIREVTAELLAQVGHAVRAAADAEDGLEMVDESTDVLLSDVSLPGMSGADLAALARERHPRLRVIFATGHDHAPLTSDGKPIGGALLLRKPYVVQALLDALRAAMRDG
jgi:CheY-like chemotaxis protein